MDAKGITEFYLGVHKLKKKKVQTVLCTHQTRITTLMTDTARVSQFLVFHQVVALALLLGVILGKTLHRCVAACKILTFLFKVLLDPIQEK